MTRFRHLHVILAIAAAFGLAACAALTSFAPAAAAFTVEDRGTAGLDGKVVMSPAAERIETVLPGEGEQISPGSVVRRSIIIHNRTKAPIDFDLDVAQVVGSTAELIVEVRHGVREGAAGWVQLEKTSFRLNSGQQGTVGVTVRIPQGIKPGSKPFAVTATQRGGPVQTQGAGIAPQFKQIGIFILELPGDAPVGGELTKATITSAQKNVAAAQDGTKPPQSARLYVSPKWTDTHRLTLSTEFENDGERLLTPSGRVVVRDVFGRVAGRYDVKEFTVYPGGESAGTVELKGLPSLGLFRARVELESEAGGEHVTELDRFLMVPKWFLLAAGLFLLYGLYRLLRWQLRRRREWKQYLDDEAAGEARLDTVGEGAADDTWSYDETAERA